MTTATMGSPTLGPVVQALWDAHRLRRTGGCRFRRGQRENVVLVRDGAFVFARSFAPEDGLGETLLRMGKISLDQYEAAEARARESGKPLGPHLVELGALDPKQLFQAMKHHVKEVFFRLLAWPEAQCVWEDGPKALAREPVLLPPQPLPPLLVEGIWQAIGTVDVDLPPSGVARPVSDAWEALDPGILPAPIRETVRAVDGNRTVEEIQRVTGNGSDAARALMALTRAGCLCLDIPIAEAEQPEAGPTVDAGVLQRTLKTVRGQNHYEILGVGLKASSKEIRRAYLPLVKQYHPDQHRLSGDMQDMLEEVFILITKAYQVLSDRSKRETYDLGRLSHKDTARQEETQRETGRAAEQFKRGRAELRSENYWGAEEAFRWATRLDPDNPRYHYQHALALMHMPRKLRTAEEACQRAIALEPTQAGYHVTLGQIYQRGGLESKAIQAYEDALTWDAENPTALEGLQALQGKSDKKSAAARRDASTREKGGVLGKLWGKKKR